MIMQHDQVVSFQKQGMVQHTHINKGNAAPKQTWGEGRGSVSKNTGCANIQNLRSNFQDSCKRVGVVGCACSPALGAGDSGPRGLS